MTQDLLLAPKKTDRPDLTTLDGLWLPEQNLPRLTRYNIPHIRDTVKSGEQLGLSQDLGECWER